MTDETGPLDTSGEEWEDVEVPVDLTEVCHAFELVRHQRGWTGTVGYFRPNEPTRVRPGAFGFDWPANEIAARWRECRDLVNTWRSSAAGILVFEIDDRTLGVVDLESGDAAETHKPPEWAGWRAQYQKLLREGSGN